MNDAVLIVDDSLTVRMDLAEALETAGYHALLCATAAEAREALARERVLLVILDVLLPDADGLELLKEIRATPSSAAAPILLLSTEAEVKDRIRGLQTGADDYVGKPYDAAYIVARAGELLRGRQRRPSDERAIILVIDDSSTFRERLQSALEADGYSVLTASSGEEGLRIAASSRPTAIVVDGVMPGIDGGTVIRRARLDAALRSTPCVLLTASEDHGAELKALDAGADAFVRKEEDLDVILARLAAVLRRARAERGDTASLLGPKRILAVDDSATYLHELATMLRGEGYDVVLARSGEEAIEMLAVQPVDCILLDLLMPGLNGNETCRRIKASPVVRDIPLIMLTALEDRESMIEGLSAGADDFIAKSGQFEVLKARVRAQIRRKQFEDEHRKTREELLHSELEATEARAAREIAEARAVLVEELKRKNEELGEQHRRVQEANRLKSEFLANMSHELRTPLNAIIGFTELMHDGKAGPVSADQEEYLRDVLTSSRHLLQLINDILDLSKVEAGKIEFRPEPLDLARVIGEVRDILRTLAAQKHIQIDVTVEPDLEEILADPGRLKQVLYNYLSNALKFSRDEGHVAVRVRPEGEEEFRIEVEDHGIGIKGEDLGRLFAEFQQLDASMAKKHAGTGLGLALTKRIVEAQGGHVGVESAPGLGSTFFAVLPRQAFSSARSEPESEIVPATPGSARILVIEDDEKDRRWLIGSLSAAGYAVETASTGAEGLARCREQAFDAITLDLLLPDLSGRDVLQEIRGGGPNRNTPVVIVSVLADEGIVAGFQVQDILQKPVQRDELIASLKRAALSPKSAGPILVVDDDPAALKLAERTLEQLGYRTVCCDGGNAGLAAAGRETPGAVILDLVMPKVDGFEFLKRFRATPAGRRTPVIIWTIHDVTSKQRERLQLSVCSIVSKAEGSQALIDELRYCLPASGSQNRVEARRGR